MTNNKQQTAVEWYRIKISSLTSDLFKEKISGEQFRNLEKEAYEQAKEMEKANILRAAKRGYLAIAEKFDLDEAQNYANEYYANCYK